MKLVNLLRFLAALIVWTSSSGAGVFAADPELETVDLPAVAQRQDVVKVGENLVVGKNEVRRDAVVIFGSATIEGEVENNLVVVAGNLT